jgi:drug/metabolite transporter (DMT)-like permease
MGKDDHTTDSPNYAINEPLIEKIHDNENNHSHVHDKKHVNPESNNNPVKGYTFMMAFVVANALADSSSKILFIHHGGLGVTEMLFLRGVIVLAFLAFLIGKQARHILYDSIPRNMWIPIFIRCSSGLLAFYCLSTAIKHLPIVLVALF